MIAKHLAIWRRSGLDEYVFNNVRPVCMGRLTAKQAAARFLRRTKGTGKGPTPPPKGWETKGGTSTLKTAACS